MPLQQDRRENDVEFFGAFGAILAFGTLFVIIYYFYVFLLLPVPSINLDPDSGTLYNVTLSCQEQRAEDPGAPCLEVGDVLFSFNGRRMIDNIENRALPVFDHLKGLEEFEVVFMKPDGRIETTRMPVDAQWKGDEAGGRGVLSSFAALFLPMLFWAMGSITVIFLRPRDMRWLLLVLFQYDTAIWTASGFLGFSQEAYSAIVYRVAIWLFLPLGVHLHLILPNSPFKRFHRAILTPLYGAAVILIALDLQNIVPREIRLTLTLIVLLACLGILVLRQWVPAPPVARIANRMLLFGVGLGLGPIIILVLLYLLDPSAATGSNYSTAVMIVFLLVSPLWPLTYIYAIYKNDLGTFEFRSNRLLGTYGFFAIYITVYLTVFNGLLDRWVDMGLDDALFGMILSLVFVMAAPPLFARFQRMVDRRVFAIKYTPNEVIEAFAAKIPAAFNREILKSVIVDEILPTLMIRGSALYELANDEIDVVYEQGVPENSKPRNKTEFFKLAEEGGQFISFPIDGRRRYAWVRLIVPLSIQDEVIGIWLLGRRDPDDFYPKSDIVLLTNLANQIAPVIENVRLVEQARQEVLENRRLQQQLVHSQKMEAIGRLSAGVAHDFNNILSVIIGYSNLVLRQYGDDEALGQAIANIKDAGERAAILTKQLLAFSRKQVMEVQLANLNTVVADVEKMLARLAGEDIELVTRLEDGLPNVHVDPGQMGQVIINLAVNARDAMPDGGKIALETHSLYCGPGSVRHEGVPDGHYVVLSVEDNGSGVDPEVKARMFEPYFTTKEMGKGTGLGLSMVYGIIDQSSGYIFVDSELGQGTRFTIYLPIAAEEATVSAADRPRRIEARGGTETILLVEDEVSVRDVTSEILRSNGYRVVVAENGEQAITYFDEFEGRIELLLTDVVMPQIKGPELARILQAKAPDLKVIYMSGYNEESILGRRIGEEGSVLIQKPFSPTQLAGRIREVLDAAPHRLPESAERPDTPAAERATGPGPF